MDHTNAQEEEQAAMLLDGQIEDQLDAGRFREVFNVRPSQISAQRSLDWPDFHPEDFCHRCGNRNITWSIDSDRFNLAMKALHMRSTAILCIACFVEGHEKATGLTCAWRLAPASGFRSLDDH